MRPTRMHMTSDGPRPFGLRPVNWRRVTLCGKYVRLELATQDWAKVDCKMCLKVKGAMK